MEAYLSPNQPRWSPTSEADIRSVIDSGVLGESHYIDVKREIEKTPRGNKELARDVASFAIDGGALLVGVAEDKEQRTFELAPQPLSNLVERIEQIAQFSIDPPLTVVPLDIESDSDSSLGYVLINIPPSPAVPHMVDGKYYGRSERVRRTLSDAEVVRLHAGRESQERRIDQLLDREIERDPVPHEHRKRGHLYVVAQPASASRTIARTLVGEHNALFEIMHSSEPKMFPNPRRGYIDTPPSESINNIETRANGTGLSSHILGGPGRTLLNDVDPSRIDDGYLSDVEFRVDGGIRFLSDRVILDSRQEGQVQQVLYDELIVHSVLRVLHWSNGVSSHCNYRGQWLFGLHIDRMRGLPARGDSYNWPRPHYDEETYREVTTAATLELEQDLAAIARRLFGRLLDGLGRHNQFQTLPGE